MRDFFFEDLPEYVSRGQRIRSVLDGSGNIDILPGRPDVPADQSDWDKGEKYNPDLDFDPNSYSLMDKFDGLEVGQELIDSQLDTKQSSSTPADSEKK